jgi:hypothetical protein
MKTILFTVALAMAAAGTARAADPTTADCLAATESSLTLRNQHKLRDARAQLLICSAATCPTDIRDECVRRVDQVNADMPTVVFEVKDGGGNDLTGVRVEMDGGTLAEHLEGTALSIDPGEHTFTFTHAGDPPVQKAFVIREGEKDRRERIVLGPAAVAALPAVAPPPLVATQAPVPAPSSWTGQRIGAVVLAAVGVAGLGVGTGFGLAAISRHDDAQKACPQACADQRGVDLWNSARTAGNISTVAFIAGGVALAGGAVLWLTGKPESAPPTRMTQVIWGPGSVGLRGAW